MNKQYEYKTTFSSPNQLNDRDMNEIGAAGWRLLQIVPMDRSTWHYWFIREVIAEPSHTG